MSKTSIEWLPAHGVIECRSHGPTMGTRYSARFVAPPQADVRTIEARLAAAVTAVDAQMSNWKPDSDLSRINRAGPGVWIPAPQALVSVLQRAAQIGHETGNAFNAAVGDRVSAWGFGPAAALPCAQPAGPAASSLPCAPLDQLLEIDTAGLRVRKHGEFALDLCGIAKGHGADELGRVLNEHGLGAWIVGIDGELRMQGHRPDGSGWAVALERPQEGARQAMGVIELNDASIATSGDYRHVTWVAGQRITHTMDPRTGAPVSNTLAAVTVVCERCVDADAYATALMVLGEPAGLALARQLGLDALFVTRTPQGLATSGTGSFAHDVCSD